MCGLYEAVFVVYLSCHEACEVNAKRTWKMHIDRVVRTVLG
jgi:hypothetical protein